MTKLGKEPELFEPPEKDEGQFLEGLIGGVFENPVQGAMKHFFQPELMGKPLYILPSAFR